MLLLVVIIKQVYWKLCGEKTTSGLPRWNYPVLWIFVYLKSRRMVGLLSTATAALTPLFVCTAWYRWSSVRNAAVLCTTASILIPPVWSTPGAVLQINVIFFMYVTEVQLPGEEGARSIAPAAGLRCEHHTRMLWPRSYLPSISFQIVKVSDFYNLIHTAY